MKLNQKNLRIGLLIAALSLSFGPSLIAGDQIAIKGREIYVDSVPLSFNFPFSSAVATAEGQSTYFGHYTIIGVLTVDVTTATGTGIYRLVAENGDILFLTLTGHALQPLSLKETVADITITGGTGRFQGATGGWHNDSHFVYPVDSGLPNPYVAEIRGTISKPAHGNHED